MKAPPLYLVEAWSPDSDHRSLLIRAGLTCLGLIPACNILSQLSGPFSRAGLRESNRLGLAFLPDALGFYWNGGEL